MAFSTAGTLAVQLIGDIRKLEQDMKKAGKSVQGFSKSVDKVSQNLTRAGKAMTLAITAPLVGFGVAAVKFASDAEEVQSKFDTVFKETASDVEAFISEFSDQVGRSETSLKEFAATFQDTFVPLGFAREEAADLSKKLVELTIDLASFNNSAEPEVMKALQSAIVGNVETVRQFGVVINQAAIEQELLSMGIRDGIRVATEAQKAQARLNLIIAGTSDAQGDATRTAGSFANQMKALQADLKDVGEEIGQILIPTITGVVDKIREWLQEFSGLDIATKETIVKIGLLAAALGPALLIISEVIQGVAVLSKAFVFLAANPILATIAILVTLGATIAVLVTTNEAFRRSIETIWGGILSFIEDVVNGAILLINGLIAGINAVIDLINKIPFANIADIGKLALVDFTRSVKNATAEAASEAVKVAQEASEAAAKAAKDALASANAEIDAFIERSITALMTFRDTFERALEAGRDPVLGELRNSFDEITEALRGATAGTLTYRQELIAARGFLADLIDLQDSFVVEFGEGNTAIQEMIESLLTLGVTAEQAAEEMKDAGKIIQENWGETGTFIVDSTGAALGSAANQFFGFHETREREEAEHRQRVAQIVKDNRDQSQRTLEDALQVEADEYEKSRTTLKGILEQTVQDFLGALKAELLLKAAARVAEGIALLLIPGFQAQGLGNLAAAGALTAGALGLQVAGFQEGALFNRETLLPVARVAEAGPEAFIPLNDQVLGDIGEGIFSALEGRRFMRPEMVPIQQPRQLSALDVGNAVAAGVVDGMRQVGGSGGREVIFEVDGQRFARAIIPALTKEELRRGTEVTVI